jgi:hypothetical protein
MATIVYFSIKIKHISFGSAFCKQGWILLKLGMHVSIGYVIIENENRFILKFKNLGNESDLYLVWTLQTCLIIFKFVLQKYRVRHNRQWT